MIDKESFTEEMIELQAHFERKLSDTSFKRYHAILSQALTTDEFKQGIVWAYRYLKPHPSFFPSPEEIIQASQGSIKDRAILEWSNVQNLSEVGKKAFAEIGGSFAIKKSENLPFLRKEFIENFQAFARNASPSELRIKEFPKVIALPVDDRPRLKMPHPNTWTPEQREFSSKQWQDFLYEQQNQSNATLYAAS